MNVVAVAARNDERERARQNGESDSGIHETAGHYRFSAANG